MRPPNQTWQTFISSLQVHCSPPCLRRSASWGEIRTEIETDLFFQDRHEQMKNQFVCIASRTGTIIAPFPGPERSPPCHPG